MNEFFITTTTSLGLIALAETGDKTQLVCMTLAARHRALPVWVGATLGLTLATTLGVVAGKTVLQRLPEKLLHYLSAAFFLLLALLAAWHALAAL